LEENDCTSISWFFTYVHQKFILNKGSTGQVLMNNKAVRVPSYATYLTKNGTMRIVVELEARLGDKLKCAVSDNDCSEHVGFWGEMLL